MAFLDVLKAKVNRYEELQKVLLSLTPGTKEYLDALKELGELERVVQLYREYDKTLSDIKEAEEMLELEEDPGFLAYLRDELKELRDKEESLKHRIMELLVPKDPYSKRSIIVEIRAGTGGEEAAIFAGDLFRMYSRFAANKGWQLEVLDSHPTDLGGYKEIVFSLKGKDVYQNFKYESGVHRVQRVPITESSGRIHTSAASVAVLPEPEKEEIVIDESEIEMETFKAGGHGGQHVNKNETAIRLTHIPTGIVVVCRDERSLHQNREKAMRILRARLLQMRREQEEKERRELRRSQIRTGDRSEKIRTYNFPQNRVTDHRAKVTFYNLQDIMNGELDDLISALREWEMKQIFAEDGVSLS